MLIINSYARHIISLMKTPGCFFMIFLFAAMFLAPSCSRKNNGYTPSFEWKKKNSKSAKAEPKKAKEKKEKPPKASNLTYQGNLDFGVVSNDYTFKEVSFGGLHTAHGINFKNGFLGLGAGIDRYDSLLMTTIGLDTRFTFSSYTWDPTLSTGKPSWVNLFVFLNIGLTHSIRNSIVPAQKGYLFNPGLGFLFGSSRDARMSLAFGYKFHEFKDYQNYSSLETFHLRLGVEFAPWLKNRNIPKR